MAEEKLKTGNHYVHTKRRKNKISANKAVSETHQMYGRNWADMPPRMHHYCKQSEMQSILDSFEKKVGKKNKQWIWNRNGKHSIVLKQSFSKPE